MNQSQDLKKEYDLRFSHIAEYRNEVWKILTKGFFQARLGENKIVLDLGCGWGEFINNISAARKLAMDLNPEAGRRINEDVEFLQQDCSKEWQLEPNSLDVVFTSNFFEHLPNKDSLTLTLRQAHRCLKPGGKIICLGPNIKYVGGAYWDFYDHYLELTHLSLAEGMRMNGFQIEDSIPKFLPYTMADGKNPPLMAVRAYLSFPVAWKIMGKQFLVTARKQPAEEIVT